MFPLDCHKTPMIALMACIVFHIAAIFDGKSVDLGGGNVVQFTLLPIDQFMSIIRSRKDTVIHPSFLKWLLASCRHDQIDVTPLYLAWVKITAAAFATKSACQPVMLMDQAELLVFQLTNNFHHSSGAQESSFTLMCGFLPHGSPNLWVGTLDPRVAALPSVMTRLKIFPHPALRGLSFVGARNWMNKVNGCSYSDDVLMQIWLFSCGVPRLLEAPFLKAGSIATAAAAFDAMTAERGKSYNTAMRWFLEASPHDVAMLLICSACKYPVTGHTVPGTAVLWGDIFNEAAAFPHDDTIIIPRFWWESVQKAVKAELLTMNMSADDLLVDPIEIFNSEQKGAIATGVPFEKLFANALAARFYLHCQDKHLPLSSYVDFLSIYPTLDTHLQSVLGDFTVCFSHGVSQPKSESFVASSTVGNSIVLNSETTSAHHDILIPAKRKSTGKLEFIAMQCRYGKRKNKSELKGQDMTCKGPAAKVMENVLLQLCNTADEGKQPFANTSITMNLSEGDWHNRQDMKLYAVISGEHIIRSEILDLFNS
jgi:hypothetical protein